MEQALDEMMIRDERARRRGTAYIALLVIGAGAFLVVRRPGHEPMTTLALGVFFLLLGAATLLWVWRGDWTPPDAERFAQRVVVTQRVGLAFRGMELLALTLALLGLAFPSLFGQYWQHHQSMVLLVGVGVAYEIAYRAVNWWAARHADAERPEEAS